MGTLSTFRFGLITRGVMMHLSCVALVFGGPHRWAPIDSSLGAGGPYAVQVDSVPHPAFNEASVYFYSPRQVQRKVPLVFFLHGIGAHHPVQYRELLEHLASRGMGVLYAPYRYGVAMSRPVAAYRMMFEGFQKGILHWGRAIDTTNIGFIGHSYGAGAVPAIAWHWLRVRRWGESGAFLFMMAPWYVHAIRQQQLQSFPQHTHVVVQVYEHDFINDHRIARDVYEAIGSAPQNKRFIMLHSDTSAYGVLVADHGVPVGAAGGEELNNLDYYGVWRVADALADLAFSDSVPAPESETLLQQTVGGGMGYWPDGTPVRSMTVTEKPLISHPQSAYLNFWNHIRNPRYEKRTFFNAFPFARQKTRMTLRNYFTLQPGDRSERTFDTLYRAAPQHDSGVSFAVPDCDYGVPGPYAVIRRSFPHPELGHGKIYLFSPRGLDGKLPVVLFLHGFQWPMPDFYESTILMLASRGYHVVFPSYILYRTTLNNRRRYDLVMKGALEGIGILRERIDSTRIGFMGHSYGGGMVPSVGWQFLNDRGWGSQGCFMFILAPWYVYSTTPRTFREVPSHCNLLVQVYEDDRFNDWRMAEDLYYSYNLDPRRKMFTIVHSDTTNGEILKADHVSTLSAGRSTLSAINHYAVNRLAAALGAATFEQDGGAAAIAPGTGESGMRCMGTWPDATPVRPVSVVVHPSTPRSSRSFLFGWNRPWNRRRREYDPARQTISPRRFRGR